MIENKKKVLFLTSRLPLPVNDGRSYTLKQYLDTISKYCEVAVVSLKSSKKIENQENYLSLVRELDYPSFFKKIFNVLTLSLYKGYPLQVSGVYSKKSQKVFNQIVKEYQPDIIICDMIRTSLYVRRCPFSGVKILDMDDILSKRYRTSIKSKEDALGQFKDMLPKAFVKIINIFHLNKFILKFETKRMEKNERKAIQYFHKILLVSPLESREYNLKYNTNKAISWPVCVKNIMLFEDIKNTVYDKNQICFLGNIDAAQNQSTLLKICNDILPKLSNNFKLLVVGKCSKENMALFEKYTNVFFTGYVDSIKDYVLNSLCLLAPIPYGSGIKIKVLESMGYGIPVITSMIGIEGLEVQNEKNVFVANTDDEYCAYINRLYDDSKEREELIKNALIYLENNHSLRMGEQIFKNEILGGEYNDNSI